MGIMDLFDPIMMNALDWNFGGTAPLFAFVAWGRLNENYSNRIFFTYFSSI
jgi:hypothetical protein